jgi:hypothetical protein
LIATLKDSHLGLFVVGQNFISYKQAGPALKLHCKLDSMQLEGRLVDVAQNAMKLQWANANLIIQITISRLSRPIGLSSSNRLQWIL